MKYLIDTDIASYYLRGKYSLDIIFERKQPSSLRLSIITVAEMEVLAYKNPHSKINCSTISNFAKWIGVLGLDQDTWQIFSLTKAETQKMGNSRGDFDLLQASIAKQYQMVLVTHNIGHYEGLVDLEDWISE